MIRRLVYRATHTEHYMPATDGGVLRISEHWRSGRWRCFYSEPGPEPVWWEIPLAEFMALSPTP